MEECIRCVVRLSYATKARGKILYYDKTLDALWHEMLGGQIATRAKNECSRDENSSLDMWAYEK